MSDKIEPIIHKLSEAVTPIDDTADFPAIDREEHDPKGSEIKQHNAELQPDAKDRLVDIGRGRDTAGRGGHGQE